MSELNIRPLGHFVSQSGGELSPSEVVAAGRSYVVEGSGLESNAEDKVIVAFVETARDGRFFTRITLDQVSREPNDFGMSVHDDNLTPSDSDFDIASNEFRIVPPIPEVAHEAAIGGIVRALQAIHAQSPQWRPTL